MGGPVFHLVKLGCILAVFLLAAPAMANDYTFTVNVKNQTKVTINNVFVSWKALNGIERSCTRDTTPNSRSSIKRQKSTTFTCKGARTKKQKRQFSVRFECFVKGEFEVLREETTAVRYFPSSTKFYKKSEAAKNGGTYDIKLTQAGCTIQ